MISAFCICAVQLGSPEVGTCGHWNVTSVNEELFLFLLNLYLNLNSHMWLVATILDRIKLKF